MNGAEALTGAAGTPMYISPELVK